MWPEAGAFVFGICVQSLRANISLYCGDVRSSGNDVSVMYSTFAAIFLVSLWLISMQRGFMEGKLTLLGARTGVRSQRADLRGIAGGGDVGRSARSIECDNRACGAPRNEGQP